MRRLPLAACASTILLLAGCSKGGGSTNRPPQIGSVPPTTARVGIPYGVTITAVDPEKKNVAFSLQAGPTGMTVDAASGVLAWTPAQGDLGPQTVSVRATDPAGLYDEQNWTIQVGYNHAPAIAGLQAGQVCVGNAMTGTLDAFDPDGDALALGIGGAPAGLVLDSSSGAVTWTPTSADSGRHDLALSAADPYGLSSELDVSLDVLGYADDASRNFSLEEPGHNEAVPRLGVTADGTTWLGYQLDTTTPSYSTVVLRRLDEGTGCPTAEWESDPMSQVTLSSIVPAADDGAFVVYAAGGPQNLMVTRLDPTGAEMWTSAVTSSAVGSGGSASVALDANGLYVHFLSSASDLRIQKLALADGARLWSDGAIIGFNTAPLGAVVPVGDGGATACWALAANLKCARVDTNGTVAVPETNLAVPALRILHSMTTPASNPPFQVTGLLHDATGYVVSFEWADFSGFPSKQGDGALRFDAANFTVAWGVSSPVDTSFNGHAAPAERPITADGNGDILFAYASPTLSVDKLARDTGNEAWVAAVPVSDQAVSGGGFFSPQYSIRAVGNDAVVPFLGFSVLGAQRIAMDGTRLWGTSGAIASSASGNGLTMRVGSQGDVVLSWSRNDPATSRNAVLVQQVKPDGTLGE